MKPNETIAVVTEVLFEGQYHNRIFILNTTEDPNDPEQGFIGITGVYPNMRIRDDVPYKGVVHFFTGTSPNYLGLLYFMFLINFGVGAFNLLPLGPLDGGRMWKVVLDKKLPKHSQKITRGLNVFVLFLLAFLFAKAFLG